MGIRGISIDGEGRGVPWWDGNGSDQMATWNSQLGPKLESQYQAGNMNCGGQEKGTLPSQYCHKIITLLLFRKITFL